MCIFHVVAVKVLGLIFIVKCVKCSDRKIVMEDSNFPTNGYNLKKNLYRLPFLENRGSIS